MAKSILSNLDMVNVSKIVNLPDPSSAQDAATKAYCDAAINGLAPKDSSRVGTQSNLNIASPGATIDGITMVSGDRVLVRAQTLPAENGIYIWNGSATPMTRSADAGTSNNLEMAITTVEEGTSAGVTYRQTLVNFTLGSGAVSWIVFGGTVGAASETSSGIAELATQAETDAGSDDLRIVTPLKLATWSGRIRKYTVTIGDGSATQYDVTHNLNTRVVQIEVYRTASPFDTVIVDTARFDVNTARFNFQSAPASGAYTVVVIG